jgi:hypothetical protein
MAWLRIESNFASHRKVLAAGQQLGKGAVARVIGIWTIGACYAVAHLTDGLVPGIILEDTRYDKKPGEIIDAMVAAGLLHAEGNGYRLHDFNDYNPSAAAVLEKRRIDVARKREFQKNSVRNPKRIAAESEKILRVPNPNPNPIPRSRSRKKEQRADARPAHAKVLVRLAHVVLDRLSPDADLPPMSELCEQLKDLAGVHKIRFATGRDVTKAMDAAVFQRPGRAS